MVLYIAYYLVIASGYGFNSLMRRSIRLFLGLCIFYVDFLVGVLDVDFFLLDIITIIRVSMIIQIDAKYLTHEGNSIEISIC